MINASVQFIKQQLGNGRNLPALWTVVLMCGALTGCFQTTTIPGRVEGDSMAPNLLGNHLKYDCEDCRYPMVFESLRPQEFQNHKLICPNCGFPQKNLSLVNQGVSHEREILPQSNPQRWDVVAFQIPGQDSVGIKRVIGLPNESIEIRNGKLDCNGKRLRRDWQTQLATRIPVHDSRYRPSSPVPERWIPVSPHSGWTRHQEAFVFEPSSSDSHLSGAMLPKWDWLGYVHWRCCSHQGPRTRNFPIEDYYGFNQSLARNLNPISDIFLEVNVAMARGSIFKLHYPFLEGSAELELDTVNRELTVVTAPFHPELAVSESVPLKQLTENPFSLVVSFVDHQILVRIDNRPVFSKSLDIPQEENTGNPSASPLRIGGAGGNIKIDRIRIWRAIHYFPIGPNPQQLSSGPTGYVLLGDNVPVSIDSRHWGQVSVDRSDIIGVLKLK